MQETDSHTPILSICVQAWLQMPDLLTQIFAIVELSCLLLSS